MRSQARSRPLATASQVLARLRQEANPERARAVARYFKTGPGEYGEGDRFLGIPVPVVRAIARELPLGLSGATRLLENPWHEARLLALLTLVRLHQRGTAAEQQKILRAYLANTRFINNWDLVDCSAGHIVGPHSRGLGGRASLVRLARSSSLWERRIAMLATSHSIARGEPDDALFLAELLLDDEHDLMHKAVGWMLREVGKRCGRAHLEAFLAAHAHEMPRTALRYAIEHLAPAARARWLGKPRTRR